MCTMPFPPGTRCPEGARAPSGSSRSSPQPLPELNAALPRAHTGASVRNVMWLQRALGLAQTGIMDDTLLSVLSALHRSARRFSALLRASI